MQPHVGTRLLAATAFAILLAAGPAHAGSADTASFTRVSLAEDGRATFLHGEAWTGADASATRRAIDLAAGDGDGEVAREEILAFARARSILLANGTFARLALDGRAPVLVGTTVNVTGRSSGLATSAEPFGITTTVRLRFDELGRGPVAVIVTPLADGRIEIVAPSGWRFEDGRAAVSFASEANETATRTMLRAGSEAPKPTPPAPPAPTPTPKPAAAKPEEARSVPAVPPLLALALGAVSAMLRRRASRQNR